MKSDATAIPNQTDRLCEIMAAVLGIDARELSEAASPDNISNWDSVNHLNLVMALESEFGIHLSAEDTLAMRNVGLIRTILREAGARV